MQLCAPYDEIISANPGRISSVLSKQVSILLRCTLWPKLNVLQYICTPRLPNINHCRLSVKEYKSFQFPSLYSISWEQQQLLAPGWNFPLLYNAILPIKYGAYPRDFGTKSTKMENLKTKCIYLWLCNWITIVGDHKSELQTWITRMQDNNLSLTKTRIVPGRRSQHWMMVRGSRIGHARVEHDTWCWWRWAWVDSGERQARPKWEHLLLLLTLLLLLQESHLGWMSLHVIGVKGLHAGRRHCSLHCWRSRVGLIHWIWHHGGAAASRHWTSTRSKPSWHHPRTLSWKILPSPLNLLAFLQKQGLNLRKLLQLQLQSL
jgi:hypothetical protein